MNATDHSTVAHKFKLRKLTLREKLLLGSTFISTAILLAAAWVINKQVVAQARQQVQAEVRDVMSIYDAVLDENARSLQRLGVTIASSPVVKTILGDNRASRDRATMHEMFVDAGGEMISGVDLVFVSDGAGRVTFAELKGSDSVEINNFDVMREAAESETQRQAFALINAKLFQLALTPVLIQSANAEEQNTLAVIGTGIELDRETAAQIKQRIHSEIVFLIQNKLYASSFESSVEPTLSSVISVPDVSSADASRPVE
ncbi:MAG TPA: cache domain-containing protein, partial [Blastocatellia bacterium]|nr:cache domain-containing protein [Blastocatellia bacterium]